MKVLEVQEWFAKVLRQPLGPNDDLIATPASEMASHYILPSLTLKPYSRIEIYAQQYWWRLFTTLQEQYPLVTRLFGYEGFNHTLATPYLLKYPPTHWNINFLGHTFPQWLQEEYFAEDKPLIMAAAQLDWSYIAAFLGKKAPLPTSETETLYLTPTSFLFSWKWDLIPFRREVQKKDPNWWVENDFPELKKERMYFTLVRRTSSGHIAADDLSEEEFNLLQQFSGGVSLKDVCLLDDTQKILINQWIKQRVFTPEKSLLGKEILKK